ncbi:HPP family protein [Thioclava sp. IC9]|uniref:HPP family protein n=1 Tax=Thioclava sp. IC9 TaxID=1973007 RepID=UPI000B53A157|nr:HPP family protein [Thioclava sp. IC9]OWY07126.1 hypothetical protein B6V76_05015 [Thioclava sp. IC9]
MPISRLPKNVRRQLRRFGPSMGRRPAVDILRGAVGAGVAILVVTFIVATLPHSRQAGIYLVSSFASMAVLLFVLPNSPLAQPWSAMMGMMISAVVPVAVLMVTPPPYADGLAVGGSIAAMMAARALHPPAAGIALLVILEHEAGRRLGFDFAIFPIAVMTVLMIGFAMVWNRLFGISYPTRPLAYSPAHVGRARGPARSLSQRDLSNLLVEFNQSANMDPADLARLMAVAEHRAAESLLADTHVRDLMTQNPVTVSPEAPLSEIVRKMTALNVHTLPVVDNSGYYLGVVDQHDALEELFKEFDILRRPLRFRAAPPEAEVRAIFHTDIETVEGDTPVGQLLERLARREARVVPVTESGRLVGILTRTDIIALLLEHSPAAHSEAELEEEGDEDEEDAPQKREDASPGTRATKRPGEAPASKGKTDPEDAELAAELHQSAAHRPPVHEDTQHDTAQSRAESPK